MSVLQRLGLRTPSAPNGAETAPEAEAAAAAEAEAAAAAEAAAEDGDDDEDPENPDAAGEGDGEAAEGDDADADADAGNGEDDDDDEDMEAAARAPASPDAIAAACAEAGEAALAAPLIKSKATLAAVRARLKLAAEIRDTVATARRVHPAVDARLADGFVAAGASLEHVRAELFDVIVAAQSAEGRTAHQAGSGPADGHGQPVDASWDVARERVAGQRNF